MGDRADVAISPMRRPSGRCGLAILATLLGLVLSTTSVAGEPERRLTYWQVRFTGDIEFLRPDASDEDGRHTRLLVDPESGWMFADEKIPNSDIVVGPDLSLLLRAVSAYSIEVTGDRLGSVNLEVGQLWPAAPFKPITYQRLPVAPGLWIRFTLPAEGVPPRTLEIQVGASRVAIGAGEQPDAAAVLPAVIAIVDTLGLPAATVAPLRGALSKAEVALRKGDRAAGLAALREVDLLVADKAGPRPGEVNNWLAPIVWAWMRALA